MAVSGPSPLSTSPLHSQTGVGCLVRELLVPALQPAVNVFVTFSHILSEVISGSPGLAMPGPRPLQEELADCEVNDPFVQQLLVAVEKTLSEMKVSLQSQRV